MNLRAFKQVDVFTAVPYLGNPLAVVLDGTGLHEADLQRFAHWTNLSETAFLLPPSAAGAAQGADYRVRIFTPDSELAFAGHPTLGSCHAWLQAGGTPRHQDEIVQECPQGLIRIRRDGTRLTFAAPPLQRCAPDTALLAQVTEALGLQPNQLLAAQRLDNGPVWLGLWLDSVETVLQLAPNHAALKELGQKVGVAAMDTALPVTPLIARSNREARAVLPRSTAWIAPSPDAPEMEVRAFLTSTGTDEDPVTGSLNASLAQWLIADGLAPSHYVASQGTCLGRTGRVYLSQDAAGQVWVGGDAVTCMDGNVCL